MRILFSKNFSSHWRSIIITVTLEVTQTLKDRQSVPIFRESVIIRTERNDWQDCESHFTEFSDQKVQT